MVRTRFAPSPTGTPESIHLGFVIRALWNYAYAKKNDGQFILRIEDTDRKRSNNETEIAIIKTLKTFNIIWDEGPDIGGPHAPYRQSERLEKYKDASEKLVDQGYAYYDFDAVKREKEEIKSAYSSETKLAQLKMRPAARGMNLEEARQRIKNGEPYVVRVKIPEEKKFKYYDWILKKEIEFEGREVQDLILLKSDGFPTYHLAVVVDDVDMQITHVFRGQEWISSTPIHLHIYEGLGEEVPNIGHFSVIIDPRTGKKFSKRDMTALFGVNNWLNKGYLSEAILNYLMLLGWAPKDNQEIFSLDEFVKVFDQDGVQKANPTFDVNKLEWMNGQYIQKLKTEDLELKIYEFFDCKYEKELIAKIVPLVQTRIKTLKEFEEIAGFFFNAPEVDRKLLTSKHAIHLTKAKQAFEKIPKWELEKINDSLMTMIKEEEFKTGDFFMDLRIAITGKKFTPPINDSIVILGKNETIDRISRLLD